MILKDGKLDMLVPRQKTEENTDKEAAAGSDHENEDTNMEQRMKQQDIVQTARQNRMQGAARGNTPEVERSAAQNMAQGRGQGMPQAAGRNVVPAGMPIDIVASKDSVVTPADSKEEKSRRLQWLLQQLIRETLQENNSELCREIKESVVKELDYQFRMQEEREEARDKLLVERSEEHYRQMDELLRKKANKKGLREKKKGKTEPKAEKDILDFAADTASTDNIPDEASREKPEKKKKRFIF